MKKLTFFLSIIAIIISVITIILFFFKVSPNSVVDSNTFISTLVALFGLAITILIGYQIYNAVEIREKMENLSNELDKITEIKKELMSEIEMSKNDIQKVVNDIKFHSGYTRTKLDEALYIIDARLCSSKSNICNESFLKMLGAIKCSLDVNHKEDGWGWLLDELKDYMLLFSNSYPFDEMPSDISNKVKEYKECFREDDEYIREHENYYLIKDRYEPLMEDFNKRLNYIAQNITVSENEVGKRKEA